MFSPFAVAELYISSITLDTCFQDNSVKLCNNNNTLNLEQHKVNDFSWFHYTICVKTLSYLKYPLTRWSRQNQNIPQPKWLELISLAPNRLEHMITHHVPCKNREWWMCGLSNVTHMLLFCGRSRRSCYCHPHLSFSPTHVIRCIVCILFLSQKVHDLQTRWTTCIMHSLKFFGWCVGESCQITNRKREVPNSVSGFVPTALTPACHLAWSTLFFINTFLLANPFFRWEWKNNKRLLGMWVDLRV